MRRWIIGPNRWSRFTLEKGELENAFLFRKLTPWPLEPVTRRDTKSSKLDTDLTRASSGRTLTVARFDARDATRPLMFGILNFA